MSFPRHELQRLGLRPAKARGQHFLVRRSVVQRILSAAELSLEDVVLEVGPGLGVLTRELVSRVRRVVAVELDGELVQALREELAAFSNLRVLQEDARKLEIGAALEGETRYKVVANLPYYAAAPILRRFLEAAQKPTLLVVMLQREVARSMAAAPGEMSLLSVATQLYGRVRVVATVPPSAFYPAPKVTSAVVRIEVYPQPALELNDVGAFFQVVRAGFSAPRKQLRNALAGGLGIAPREAEELLGDAGIDIRRRAETLALEEWGDLYRTCRVH